MPDQPTAAGDRASFAAYLLLIFALAVCVRLVIFTAPLRENDEVVYVSLADQLLAGKGYTLQGTELLAKFHGEMAGVYDGAWFIHPPLGPAFFAAFAKLTGSLLFGAKLAQLACFALFYFCGLWLAQAFFPSLGGVFRPLVPLLFAFTPIFAQTSTKIWIDNPRLAFLCLHGVFVVLSLRRGGWALGLGTALTSLLPTLTKVDCLSAYPFLYALAWKTTGADRGRGRALAALFALNLGAAGAWLYLSDALAHNPGRPTAAQLAANPFLREVTQLSSARYLLDFAEVVATLLPSLLTLLAAGAACAWNRAWARPRAILLAWIAAHLALYSALGAFGYTKLLRHLIMTVPATCLLFVAALEDFGTLLRKKPAAESFPLIAALGLFLFLGLLAETGTGLWYLLYRPFEPGLFPLF